MTGKTSVTLVTGGTVHAREVVIVAMVADSKTARASSGTQAIGIILEGIPDGNDAFAPLLDTLPSLMVARIAPGCPCCMGNLTMRVTLNRILRVSPQHLYISLATDIHLDQVRGFLTQPPYDKLIKLVKDLPI